MYALQDRPVILFDYGNTLIEFSRAQIGCVDEALAAMLERRFGPVDRTRLTATRDRDRLAPYAGDPPEYRENQLPAISRALADPKRLCVLECLSQGERSVSDLSREASCQVPNMSQHLSVLRSAGIVESRREGNTVLYRLSDPRILEAYKLIQSVAD